MTMTIAPRPISPCVGICRIDEASGYCLGCARTGDEIAVWKQASESERQAVWDALPERFDALGVTCRLLAWDAGAARRFVADTVARAAGTWVLGVVGAIGEFMRTVDESVKIGEHGDAIEATTDRACLRLQLDDRVRVLSVGNPAAPGQPDRIVLALPRSELHLPVAAVITDYGVDENAVDPTGRHSRLFDLGLCRSVARFCVRTGDPVLIARLAGEVGKTWLAALPTIGPTLVSASPVRVIETGLGRIEIATPIPPPGGVSPDGPHTHLLPDHLATKRDVPVGMNLPSTYVPGAIFYPRRDAGPSDGVVQ